MLEKIEDIFTLYIPCIIDILFTLFLGLIMFILEVIAWLGLAFIVFAPFIAFIVSDGFR